MSRRSLCCPASPLFAAGAVLTLTGAALYVTPGDRPGVAAAGALVLAAMAAWWCASRQR
ncbi:MULTISPECIES: hypothetical protein [unclassified Streptomyces]|uniref:hypothetical protein n=1 Tax=unclassified Streptomyces TaxID=2593676 RepID=UPI0013A6D9D2|nr:MULTISPECIES: hypothetical protein [unclassified Streptomyces]